MLKPALRAVPLGSRSVCPACQVFRLHTSRTARAERPPTFTTPDPSLRRANDDEAATAQQQPHNPSKPLPSTEIPVEDYASPTMHTFGFFAQLFRYAVFGSVAVVVVAASAVAGVHAYVELVALKGSSGDEDGEQWSWDGLGWSGSDKGGTDSRLGIVARAQVRSAWLAENWGGAGMPSNVAGTVRSSPTRAGGATIGSSVTERAINDPSWLLSETYLLLALKRAEERGLHLNTQDGGIDRAVYELEQRLARIRTKIGGRALLDARDGYEKMYYAIEAIPDKTPREKRDLLAITTKLGEVYQRLGANATGRWTGGLVKALVVPGASLGSVPVPDVETAPVSESSKHATPKSSFFAFWSRSHPAPVAVTNKTALPPTSESRPIDSLVAILQSAQAREYAPSMRRAILDALTKLETALAKSRQLKDAQRVQLAASRFASEAAAQSRASSLTALAHSVSSSVIQAHLAEVSLALRDGSVPAERLLDDSIEKVTNVLLSLEQDTALAKSVKTPAAQDARRTVEKDAKKGGAISSALAALVQEGKCRKGDGLACDRARELYDLACKYDPLDPAPRKGADRMRVLKS